MTFWSDPLTVAVAMGLLNPIALADDDDDTCSESDREHRSGPSDEVRRPGGFGPMAGTRGGPARDRVQSPS